MYLICICILFYLGSAAIALAGMKIRKSPPTALLTRDETDYIKGIAALMVFLAHSQIFLTSNDRDYLILKPFSLLGGVGVLLFFFLSGYGIFKGYIYKNPSLKYWKNRILNVFIPATSISLFSCIVINFINNGKINVWNLLKDSFSTQWYIDVIMLEYFAFFVAWNIARKNKVIVLILTFIFSVLIGFVFWKTGFNARWYNGLLLFPTGMLLGFLESKILSLSKIKIRIAIFLSLGGFIGTGFLFEKMKGLIIGDLMKTISGFCLAFLFVMIVSAFVVGNKVVFWLGKRSLYIYLCHLYLLLLFSGIIEKGILFQKAEIWIFLLLFGTIIYSEIMYLIFSKGFKRKKP